MSMMIPGGTSKITMTQDDGTTIEMDGIVTRIDLDCEPGGLPSTTVQFEAAGPGTFTPEREKWGLTAGQLDRAFRKIGAAQKPLVLGEGIIADNTPDGIVLSCPVPYRPWDAEWCLIVAMVPVAAAVWYVVPMILEAI